MSCSVGGIGAPRVALRNLGVPVKAIDYVEIDQKAVRSYNAIFAKDFEYKTQDVRTWTLKADILIHGSPCQDVSVAGHLKGADEGSGTRSSLMWETIKLIESMGVWKPRVVIWENVKGILHKKTRHNFDRYLSEMKRLGYTSSYACLDAKDFGLPQSRQRVFTVSILGQEGFDFSKLEKKKMRPLQEFLEYNIENIKPYLVTQPSILEAIGKTGLRRATVITDCANTITCRQDRTPTQVIKLEDESYRFLTERECWRLMGFNDQDFDAALKASGQSDEKMKRDLYKQAGNSMPIPVLEEIFRQLGLRLNNYKEA